MEPLGRREIDAVATALVARHGAQILATARRYAATPEDAEDAYQRGLEILLRKAPTTREYELVPWLKTVVIRTFDVPALACAIHSPPAWVGSASQTYAETNRS
jgi:hypothetical protein